VQRGKRSRARHGAAPQDPPAHLWRVVDERGQHKGEQPALVVGALPEVQHPAANDAQELKAHLRGLSTAALGANAVLGSPIAGVP
jgi:hypothetical protein